MSASPIGPRSLPATDHPVPPAHAATDSKAEPSGCAHRGDGVDASNPRAESLIEALLRRVPPADRSAAKTAIPAILHAARAVGETDPNRIGYLLATAQTESDFGAHMTETGHSPDWYEAKYGGDDGNRPGTDDGYRFRGRGYVQTTHAGRYAELSHRLGLPDESATDGGHRRAVPALVAQPDRLTEPALAARALVTGVRDNLFTHNAAAALERTIPPGRPPGSCDFYHARGIVNGIVSDQALTIARHATAYAEVLDGYRHSVLGTPASK